MTPPTGSGKEARRQKGLPNADCRFRLPPGRAATSTPRPGRRESAKSRELCATSTREARHRGPLCCSRYAYEIPSTNRKGSLLAPNDVVPIAELLTSLGFSGERAERIARAALIDAGLTTPRKTNVAANKKEQIADVLGGRFIRVCESNDCVAKARVDGRERVTVSTSDCEVCAGGNAGHALSVMFEHIERACVRRVLVVGGSPSVHTELAGTFARSGVELDLVRGDRALDSRRAEALANRADVIVVWGNSILAHKVSMLFTQPRFGHKRVPLSKRGIRSFADAVTQHLQLTRRL